MASLYLWKGNEATVCRFHKTPSDWDLRAAVVDRDSRAHR
jgi:hypothetical protein